MSTARGAVRALMRARARAFDGDARALDAAREEIRARFEEARDADEARARAMIREANDAARFIRENVVQARREEEDGTFKMAVEARHAEGLTIERADGRDGGGCGSAKKET